MDYLKYVKQQQETNPDIEIFGGVNKNQIDNAEKELRIFFPNQYASFLSQCGSCGIPDNYISGLFQEWDNLTSTGSTVHDTLEARKNYNLPNEYIVLEYMIDENYYLLKVSDKERVEDGEVYSVDISIDGNLHTYNKIFNSFEEYFKFALEE